MAGLADRVRVDPRGGGPLFNQLRMQIIDLIRDGQLAPGARLPTVRELAGELNLAVNTVARAYRELEAAGVVETRGRFGTFVARSDPVDVAMASAAHTFVSASRALGVEKAEALRYVEQEFG
ncbi:MAG: GntR family transcriptional regulator [Actinomycetia bacterium]|nr:GntR family transcriptional regulator [Actinomycetes bacterium]